MAANSGPLSIRASLLAKYMPGVVLSIVKTKFSLQCMPCISRGSSDVLERSSSQNVLMHKRICSRGSCSSLKSLDGGNLGVESLNTHTNFGNFSAPWGQKVKLIKLLSFSREFLMKSTQNCQIWSARQCEMVQFKLNLSASSEHA